MTNKTKIAELRNRLNQGLAGSGWFEIAEVARDALEALEAAEARIAELEQINKHFDLAVRKAKGVSQFLLRRAEKADKRTAEVEAKAEEVNGWYVKMKTRMLAAEAALRGAVPVTNPVLAYADNYRSMANRGVENISVWSVITDLERHIAPLFTTPHPAPVVVLPTDVFERLEHASTHLSDGYHYDEHSAKVNRRDLITTVEYLRKVKSADGEGE